MQTITMQEWKRKERFLRYDIEGQEIYSLLLGNIERHAQELEGMHSATEEKD